MSLLVIEFKSDSTIKDMKNRKELPKTGIDPTIDNSGLFIKSQKIFRPDFFHFVKMPIRKLCFYFTPGLKLIEHEWAFFWKTQFFDCKDSEIFCPCLRKKARFQYESDIVFKYNHETSWYLLIFQLKFHCKMNYLYLKWLGWTESKSPKLCRFLIASVLTPLII